MKRPMRGAVRQSSEIREGSQLQICKGQIFFCILMFHMVYHFLACQSKRSECALSRSALMCLDADWF